MRLTHRSVLAAGVAGALLLACCGSETSTAATTAGSSSAVSSAGSGSAGEITGTVTVFAAQSLKKSLDALAEQFQADHPGTRVSLSYDGSSALATQLTSGARADVFVSADQKNMTIVTDARLTAQEPTLFASNTLQIAVKPGNPQGVTGLADLAKADVVTVLCAPEVPCGSAAAKALTAAGVTVDPASEEDNVAAVVTQVAEGDADAGLVYRTDVAANTGKIEGIDFPEASTAVNLYPIATLKGAPNAAGAQAFVDLVTGVDGRKVLADNGFAGLSTTTP